MFPIDYFKIVADELPYVKFKNKNDIITAIQRTAIGRYYYYIFLKYREWLRNVLTNQDKTLFDEPSGKHHILIQRTLEYYGISGIAKKYLKLRNLRNDCDYDLLTIVDENTINKAKLIVFSLEKGLDSIKPGTDLDKAFTKAVKMLSLN